MDRIDCLRAFVRVMESGSFSSAAKELGIGQPAVSKRIALLEQEFATQLFLRSTRKLTPTTEAHRIYDLARQLLGNFEQAASIGDAALQPTGLLRISAPSSFGRHYVVPLVADYLRDHPPVQIDLQFSERLVDLIEEGIELAVHIGPLEPSSFVARRIGVVRHHLVATPDYLGRRGRPRTPNDLRDHVCIRYLRGSRPHEWEFESETGRHVVATTGALALDDVDAMTEAVLCHFGLAILPAWRVIDPLRAGTLEIVLPDYAVPASTLHVIYPETRWMSTRASSFLNLLLMRSHRLSERWTV